MPISTNSLQLPNELPDGIAISGAQADIANHGPDQRYLCSLLYWPFDIRFTYWTGKTKGFLAYPRREVMQHVIGHQNIGMIFNRQIAGDSVSHFGVSRIPICHGTFYLCNNGQDYFAPLNTFDDDLLSVQQPERSNFTPLLTEALRQRLGTITGGLSDESVFHYIHTVFHSPGYRSRYSAFLKIDFPRLPLTGSLKLFRELARLGGELTAFHLLEFPQLDSPRSVFVGSGQLMVEKVSWSQDTVWLDKACTRGFRPVPEPVWKFRIGGYQVCDKWLKDRKGRTLSPEDVAHYHRIVIALAETIRLMAEIDATIEQHGGWPGAFQPAATAEAAQTA